MHYRLISCFWLYLAVFVAHPGWATEINARDEFCQKINDPSSGREIVLQPGTYAGHCKIRRGGAPGDPLVIRGASGVTPPRIDYRGKDSNVFEIYADDIVIRGLEFGPTQQDVDGIRVFSGNRITVEECKFSGMGGIAIVANHKSVSSLTVRRNTIIDSRATAMYFGCHDGFSCVASDLLIERNFVSGVSAPDPEIGYGVQIKLNSDGIIRDNIIVNTKGPGIMVYGSNNRNRLNLVEKNFVSGSRTSAGIVVGGGPATVWNNIAASNREAGITLQDYGRRGLLKGILVTHNTTYNNAQAGILIDGSGSLEAIISYNAVSPESGMPGGGLGGGLKIFGNQACTSNCFQNPEKGDFTPAKDSPFIANGKRVDVVSGPANDFFGRRRSGSPAVGAVEPPGGIVQLKIKP